MNFENMVEKAQRAMDNDNPEQAQAYALMAIADRLDRLCAVESGKGGRGPRF